jgi:hypothetical protein
MEVPINKSIHSPLRSLGQKPDEAPSFVVFPSMQGRGYDEFEFTWKDHGLGITGNIFSLIKTLYGLQTFDQVYALISQDFGLHLMYSPIQAQRKIVLFEKPEIVDVDLRVKSIEFTKKGLEFWKNPFQIDQSLLQFYNTTQISMVWKNTDAFPSFVQDPTFAYRIGNKYQIYSPLAAKKDKFRNNLPERYFFGYLQLPLNGDDLIIDKSYKDVIFCRRLGYWAVSGKSETTKIPHDKMLELKQRFKNIYLMLDPDVTGKKMTEEYLALYPWLKPRFLTQAKDKTDLCKLVGFEQSKKIIKETIYGS